MSDQVTKFLETASQVNQTTTVVESFEDMLQPRVVFPSEALTLTLEQEELLVQTALQRKREMEGELGCKELGEGARDVNRFVNLRNNWMPKRELCDKMYEGDVAWRETAFPTGESIFESHNINLPMTRKIVQQQYSRAQNYFFDTDPWFSARPLRQVSEDIAERHEYFLKFKAKQSKLKPCFNTALKRAFINGEVVLKGTYKFDSDTYEDVSVIAIDAESGEHLLAGDGDYIFEDDIWVPLRDEESGVFLDADMRPISEDGQKVFVLERHPETIKPDEPFNFSREKIRRQIVHYQGADLDPIWYQDFLCPLQARSIEEADCVVHLYDESVVNIVQKYMDGTSGAAINDPKFIKMVQDMATADGTPKSQMGQRFHDNYEDEAKSEPIIQIGEFYIRIDLGDGHQKSLMLVMDLQNERPIFYDYVARIAPGGDGRRPFRCLRINPVENRWYGNSQVGLFWGLQELLDLTINRLNKSQSESARVDFWDPTKVTQGRNNPNLTFNAGETYTLERNAEAKQALSSIYLGEIKSQDFIQLMQIIQQFAQSLAGTSSANDQQMAGLDSSSLATGIRHLERAGQEMFGPLLDDLIPGVQESTEMFFKITVANLDEEEIFDYFKEGHRVFDAMMPEETKDLEYAIEINLTTYRGEQQLVQRQGAIDAVERFYAFPPEIQAVVAPLFQDVLKLYETPNAEQVIQPVGVPLLPPQRGDMLETSSMEALPQPNRPEVGR